MPISIQSYDRKIADLIRKKKDLEAKQSHQLVKYLSQEIGSDFSPELVACFIRDAWSKNSPEQKGTWLRAAEKFHFNKPFKSQKSPPKKPNTHQQIREKKV